FGRAARAPLDPGALLDPPVVALDGPTELGERAPRQIGHPQVVGGPVRDATVWDGDPEYLHKPETGQPALRPRGLDRRVLQGPRALAVEVHPPVRLEPGEPRPP